MSMHTSGTCAPATCRICLEQAAAKDMRAAIETHGADSAEVATLRRSQFRAGVQRDAAHFESVREGERLKREAQAVEARRVEDEAAQRRAADDLRREIERERFEQRVADMRASSPPAAEDRRPLSVQFREDN